MHQSNIKNESLKLPEDGIRQLEGWSAIAARLPGRTDNEIKNYWHGHLKKKLKQSLNTTIGVEAIGSTDRKEIMEARIVLQHQMRSDQNPSLKPSISQQGAVEAARVDQFRFSYNIDANSGTLKMNGSNNIDANRDFWYKLFMENSNEFVHENLGDSFPN
ncbi:hypothetical protein REPUB_Repub06bG0045000 [Reevesia pubescens]